jgi:hypothetical protein
MVGVGTLHVLVSVKQPFDECASPSIVESAELAELE